MSTGKNEISVIDNTKNQLQASLTYNQSGKLDIYNPATLKNVIQVAGSLAASTLVPEQYRRNAENCFIALYRSELMGIDPFTFMEQSYVLKGRVGFEAKFLIGRLNESKKTKGPLTYKFTGNIIRDKNNFVSAQSDLICTAIGVLRETDLVYEQSYELATAIRAGYTACKLVDNKIIATREAWHTITREKMQYMAASNWIKMYCPEVLGGAKTVEDLEYADVEVVDEEQEAARKLFSQGVNTDEEQLENLPKDPALKVDSVLVKSGIVDTDDKTHGVVITEEVKERLIVEPIQKKVDEVSQEVLNSPNPPEDVRNFRAWFENKFSSELSSIDGYMCSIGWLKPGESIPSLKEKNVQYIFNNYIKFAAAFEAYKKKVKGGDK